MALNVLEKALTDLRRCHGELYASVGAGAIWAAISSAGFRVVPATAARGGPR